MRRRGCATTGWGCVLSLEGEMMGIESRSGGGRPMWRKTCSTCRRKSASNSGALSVVKSSPYHQNQSLPSAASAAA